MKPGHEDCPHEYVEAKTLEGVVDTYYICEHWHNENIVADDVLGNGPVVGHYCHCCGSVWIDRNYVMKGQQ